MYPLLDFDRRDIDCDEGRCVLKIAADCSNSRLVRAVVRGTSRLAEISNELPNRARVTSRANKVASPHGADVPGRKRLRKPGTSRVSCGTRNQTGMGTIVRMRYPFEYSCCPPCGVGIEPRWENTGGPRSGTTVVAWHRPEARSVPGTRPCAVPHHIAGRSHGEAVSA